MPPQQEIIDYVPSICDINFRLNKCDKPVLEKNCWPFMKRDMKNIFQ